MSIFRKKERLRMNYYSITVEITSSNETTWFDFMVPYVATYLLSQKFKTNAKLLTQVQKRTTHKKRERESICNVNLCLCFNFINTKKKSTQNTACHRRRRRSGRLLWRIWLKGTQKSLSVPSSSSHLPIPIYPLSLLETTYALPYI